MLLYLWNSYDICYKNYNEIDNLTKETIVTCSGVNNIEELSLEEINSFFNGKEEFINNV